eukprot:scaffold34804_cov58-Phaeocystis_antarctica.AAC.2
MPSDAAATPTPRASSPGDAVSRRRGGAERSRGVEATAANGITAAATAVVAAVAATDAVAAAEADVAAFVSPRDHAEPSRVRLHGGVRSEVKRKAAAVAQQRVGQRRAEKGPGANALLGRQEQRFALCANPGGGGGGDERIQDAAEAA